MMMELRQRKPFVACKSHHARRQLVVSIRAENDFSANRRAAVLSGASLLALPLLLSSRQADAKETAPGKSLIEVRQLNSFQKKAEKEAFLAIVTDELKKELSPEDAAATVRLVLNDAGTFDITTGTGGINGSIFLDEELSRPENQDLKPIVEKLKKVRSSIKDRIQKQGFALISYADLEVLAAKVANEKDWAQRKRASGVPSSGDIISSAFGAAWPVKIGRVDATEPSPAGRVPGPNASVQDITTFFAKLGNKDYGATGFFAPKPFFGERQAFVLYSTAQDDIVAAEEKFASDPVLGKKYVEYKTKYERSRATVTRTDYEVDFIDYFTALAGQGATFDADKYYVPIEIDTPRF